MKNLLTMVWLAATTVLIAQDDAGTVLFKIGSAIRASGTISIDGQLDERMWSEAPVLSDFVVLEPEQGATPLERTDVRVLYDDKALYVGAIMHDSQADKIATELGVRDDDGANTDKFSVFIDGMNSRQNAFNFGVMASGVQYDKFESNDGGDSSWDGVWSSAVKLNTDGWIVELRIPYSAVRFSNDKEQTWVVNFARELRRKREVSVWSPIDQTESGFVSQFGEIHGISDIQAPLRLSLLPYLTTYSTYASSDNTLDNKLSGGLDLKLGLSKAHTLDMALVPDFGQVQPDNLVLNLGPFEQYYEERRPFFTEGVDLFGRASLFYSRRVGGEPIDTDIELDSAEYIARLPERPQLVNALKVSGRDANGNGIGVFNAITKPTFATIATENGQERKELIDPLTNYNVLVYDKLFKNNSYFSFINTNVIRGQGYYDANVTGTEFSIANKANTYSLRGVGALSQIYQKDEAGNLQPTLGYKYGLNLGKISGNFTWRAGQAVCNNQYNQNDLGYQTRNNYINHFASISYTQYTPIRRLNQYGINFNLNTNQYYNGKFESASTNLNGWFTHKKFFSHGFNINLSPLPENNYYESRNGQRLIIPASGSSFYWISTNYQKKFAFDANVSSWSSFGWKGTGGASIGVSPRYRFNDHFNISLGTSFDRTFNDIGFSTFLNGEPLFSKRNIRTISNNLSANYLFNSKMALSLTGRHYWALVEPTEFYTLRSNATLQFYSNTLPYDLNLNFNSFNLDLVFSWRFAPGSDLFLLYRSNLNDLSNLVEHNYFQNLNNVFQQNNNQTLSLRVVYYLEPTTLFQHAQ